MTLLKQRYGEFQSRVEIDDDRARAHIIDRADPLILIGDELLRSLLPGGGNCALKYDFSNYYPYMFAELRPRPLFDPAAKPSGPTFATWQDSHGTMHAEPLYGGIWGATLRIRGDNQTVVYAITGRKDEHLWIARWPD